MCQAGCWWRFRRRQTPYAASRVSGLPRVRDQAPAARLAVQRGQQAAGHLALARVAVHCARHQALDKQAVQPRLAQLLRARLARSRDHPRASELLPGGRVPTEGQQTEQALRQSKAPVPQAPASTPMMCGETRNALPHSAAAQCFIATPAEPWRSRQHRRC